MKMLNTKESPCLTCERVRLPQKCSNKQCDDWQKWFTERWKGFNNFYNKYKENKDG